MYVLQYHGWCNLRESCCDSHNIRRIVRELHLAKGRNSNNSSPRGTSSSGTIEMLRSALLHNAKHSQPAKRRKHTDVTVQVSNISSPQDSRSENVQEKSNNKDEILEASKIQQLDDISKQNSIKSLNAIDYSNNDFTTETSQTIDNVRQTNNLPIIGTANGTGKNVTDDKDINASASKETGRNNVNPAIKLSSCEGHSAGLDAFMTGYIFASYINEKTKFYEAHSDFSPACLGLTEHVNKVYLMGKNIPFLVRQTPFSKLSKRHSEKIKLIREISKNIVH